MSNTANSAQTVNNDANVTNETNSDITVFADVLDNYRKADKGDKARIRANANKSAMSALSTADFANATIWANTVNAMKADKPVIEVNHGQIAANALNALNVAKAAIEAYMAEHDITDVSDITPESDSSDKGTKFASSLLSVKSDRRSIDDVFARAFDGKPIGTVMKVSAICAAGSTPDYTPGSGAVAARLRGDEPRTLTDDCTVTGIVPVWVASDGTVAESWSPSVNVGAQSV